MHPSPFVQVLGRVISELKCPARIENNRPSMEKLTILNCSELPDCGHQRPQEVAMQFGFIKQGQLLQAKVFLIHVVYFNFDEVGILLARSPHKG